MGMDDLRVECVSADDEAAVPDREWQALADADPGASAYLLPAFVRSCARYPAAGDPPLRLVIARARRGGELLGLVPCATAAGERLRPRTGYLGDPDHLMQRRGMLLVPGKERPAVRAALARHLIREPWDRFCARTLLADEATALGNALREAGMLGGVRLDMASPYLPLPKSYAEYLASRTASQRETLNRKARRLKKEHRVEVRILRHPDEVAAALPQVAQVAAQSWSHRRGTSILSPAGPERIFFPLLRTAAEHGQLWLGLLYIDDQPAAVEIDLIYRGVVYLQKPFYDERAANLSPGQYLMCQVLSHAMEQGLREYDFGGYPDPYKVRMAGAGCLRQHVTLWVYRKRPIAAAEYLLRHRILPRLRRWDKVLPDAL